ncbi:hypothetical protein MSZK_12330 [Mycobacterium sp. shizuoka-1]|nr:hypothetical protein MSZK_12330 [Mycobacterium sp. shizuoka-1]
MAGSGAIAQLDELLLFGLPADESTPAHAGDLGMPAMPQRLKLEIVAAVRGWHRFRAPPWFSRGRWGITGVCDLCIDRPHVTDEGVIR